MYACMCQTSRSLLLLHFLAALYKRLDGDHVFATALTTVAPNNKGGTVLHPSVSALFIRKRRQVTQRAFSKNVFSLFESALEPKDSPITMNSYPPMMLRRKL